MMPQPMLSSPAWSAYRRTCSKYYQQSFNSFLQMIGDEKKDARQMVLIEDTSQKLPYISKKAMEALFDTEIKKTYPYTIGNRFFCLIHMSDYPKFVQKYTRGLKEISPRILSRFFPISSVRLKKLIKFSENPSPIYNVPVQRKAWKLLIDNSQGLDNENYVESIVNSVLLNELESKFRFFLITQLEEAICQAAFDKLHLLPFGSSVNGFGWNSSDLDLCLVPKDDQQDDWKTFFSKFVSSKPDDDLYPVNAREGTKKILKSLSKSMENLVPGMRNILPILGARVPIIKFNSEFTGLDCDLTFQSNSHESGIDIAHVLYTFSQFDPRVLKLMVMTKIWAERQELTRKSTPGPYLTNFSLMLLVIHFLQVRKPLPLLPPISHLKIISLEDQTYSNFTDTSNPESSFLDEGTPLVTLLTEFFRHLSAFDFVKYGCNVIDGAVVHKPFNDPVYIENPLQRELNVSRNFSNAEKLKMIYVAKHSYRILKNGGHVKEILLAFSRKSFSLDELLEDE